MSRPRWRDRVAGALLPRRSEWRRRTRALGPRWQPFVVDALAAEERYRAAVRRVESGPLRDRLEAIGSQVADAVEETWRVAAAGQDLTDARADIDVADIIGALATAEGEGAEARRRQLDSAKRIDQRLAATERHLSVLDARLDEVVTRTLELAAVQEVEGLDVVGSAVDDVVGELQALSAGLGELPAGPADPRSARAAIAGPPPPPPGGEAAVEPPAPPHPPPYEGPMPDDPEPDPLLPRPSSGAGSAADGDEPDAPPAGTGPDAGTRPETGTAPETGMPPEDVP